MSQIQVVQSFAVVIDGKTKTFATELEARVALNTEAVKPQAQAYVDSAFPLTSDGDSDNSKLRASKFNVVVDFLAWQAAQAAQAE